MTGREWYRRLEPLFDGLTAILRLLPRAVSRVLYSLVFWVPGHLGIACRVPLARRLARSCGRNFALHHHVIIKDWGGLTIGDNVQIHSFCYLDASGGITIGNEVSVAHSSSLLSFEHTWADADVAIKYNQLAEAPVVVEDDVWIGCGVRILCGAVIRSRAIIAAGAVVTRGVHERGIHAGVPARHKKMI